MTETALRLIKPNAYGVAGGGYCSFEVSAGGAVITSRLYSTTGALAGVRDTQAMSPAYSVALIVGIQLDPLGNVGPGAWAWAYRDGFSSGKIFCWDAAAGTLHNYPVPSGWVLSAPAYLDGYLYWWEFDTSGSPPRTWSLRKATCDLGTVVTVGSVSANPGTWAGGSFWSSQLSTIALSRTKAFALMAVGGTGAQYLSATQPLDGSAGTLAYALGWIHGGPFVLLPGTTDHETVGAGRDGSTYDAGFLHKPDDNTTAPLQRWPQTAGWSLSDRFSQCWVSPDGTRAVVTGSDDGSTPKVIGASTLVSSGSPDFVLVPALVDSDLSFGFMPMP